MKRTVVAIVIGLAVGILAGLGGYTFIYAKGYSYLTNNPEACANCHVMQDYFTGYINSSHRSVAVCNDCHTPAGFVGKYSTKAQNGFWHSFYFTTGWFPDNLQANKRNRQIAEQSCRKCHQDIIHDIEGVTAEDAKRFSCVRCHGSVGHLGAPGTVASIHSSEGQND